MTHPKLRLAFAGTPKLARVVLESLISKNEYDIPVVFTQPDRPAGRGRKLLQSEVKQCAIQHKVPLLQPANSIEFQPDSLKSCDLLLVVAYGILLSAEVINKPRLGCINIHTSLLPRWRGAAPIRRAIEAGDKESGITIMQMDTGLDTGPILVQAKCPIYDNDTGESLYDRLAELSANRIHPLLTQIANGEINPIHQDSSMATYANKISKEEAALDWNKSAIILERKVRAFNPAPVTYTKLNNLDMRIWEAKIKPCSEQLPPGTIIKDTKTSIDVVTSEGILSITKLQLPGKRIITAKDFLNGRPDFFSNV